MVRPVSSASFSVIAPQPIPRRKKVEQSLSGRGVIEDIAEERSEGGFFDEALQPVGRRREACEENE